jgi:hypothetical protein
MGKKILEVEPTFRDLTSQTIIIRDLLPINNRQNNCYLIIILCPKSSFEHLLLNYDILGLK